jgi:sugar transferase EpsL
MGKRAFDIVFSILAIIVALPLGAIVAVFLWLMQGTVIFRQVRPGLHGKPFVLFKFCSMTNARNDRGELLPDRLRLTRAGKLLRSLSLDELPQFWNVLRGDMSLVGPRPLLMEYLERYSPEQSRRHAVKPGITGWAQVNGRNSLSWSDRLEMDVWYVDHLSARLDLTILFKTIGRVIGRSGISNKRHVTMPEFTGSSRPAERPGEPLPSSEDLSVLPLSQAGPQARGASKQDPLGRRIS